MDVGSNEARGVEEMTAISQIRIVDLKAPVQFDEHGRMQYHPEIHAKHGKPWTTHDQKYLIDFYYVIGNTQMSFDLERPMNAIAQRVCQLRKIGLLVRPKYVKRHPRMRPNIHEGGN